MIRLVLIALVLLGGFYAHGRLTFSEPRVMGWMTQHAARSMQGDSVACDDYADDRYDDYRSRPIDSYQNSDRCRLAESRIRLPDGRTDTRYVRTCPDQYGRYRVVD